jgi:hypothetical protein
MEAYLALSWSALVQFRERGDTEQNGRVPLKCRCKYVRDNELQLIVEPKEKD